MANQSKERWERDPRYNRSHDVDPEFLLGLERTVPSSKVEKVSTGDPVLDKLHKTYEFHKAPEPPLIGWPIATGSQVDDFLKGRNQDPR
jgi:hypothetical protein